MTALRSIPSTLCRSSLVCAIAVFMGGNHLMGASVEFLVTDFRLATLPYKVATFTEKGSGKNFASAFGAGLRAKNIPFGTYFYTLVRKDVRDPNLSTIKGELYLSQDDIFIPLSPAESSLRVVGGREAYVSESPMEWPVRGNIMNVPPAAEPVWVRVFHVPSGYVRNVKVSAKGEFDFKAVAGNYVVTFIGGKSVLHAIPVVVPPQPSNLNLRLICCNAAKLGE